MSAPGPTLADKLTVVPAILLGLGRFFANILVVQFRDSNNRAPSASQDSFRAFARALTASLSVSQLQMLLPSTSATFQKWQARHPSEVTSSESISEGAKLHWIGDRKLAERIILFFHGGGYALPLSIPHINLVNHFRNVATRATGLNVAVAILEYTLVPAPYPTQLRQATAALQHLLDFGHPASNILLSGDSAGSHLAFTLVSHLLHPHPSVPNVPDLNTALAGVLLISPRASRSMDSPSYQENSNKDILTAKTVRRWVNTYNAGSVLGEPNGTAKDGPYTSPLDAPAEWWNDFSSKVARRVLITGGGHECMHDDIVSLAKSWGNIDGLEVTLEIEPKGAHDTPMHDIDQGRLGTPLQRAMENWIAKSFIPT